MAHDVLSSKSISKTVIFFINYKLDFSGVH